MSDEKLRQLLAQVHERLGNAASLDAEERRLLTTVTHDIERTLARKDAGTAPTKPRLESLAIKFQTDHPALADALRQLADTLGKAGI